MFLYLCTIYLTFCKAKVEFDRSEVNCNFPSGLKAYQIILQHEIVNIIMLCLILWSSEAIRVFEVRGHVSLISISPCVRANFGMSMKGSDYMRGFLHVA